MPEALDSGRLDLVIASYRRVPERFAVQNLLTERHVWVVRADHPASTEPLTLERLATLPQLTRALSDDKDTEHDLLAAGRGLGPQDGAGRRLDAGYGHYG